MSTYAIEVTVADDFEATVNAVREAFKSAGFGVVTEMNVQATLQQKLGVDVGPYLVLGMCHPALAFRAIQTERAIGVLLPCNVLVRREGASTVVSAQDPAMMADATGNAALEPLAHEVRAAVLEALRTLTG